jgi:hypothetical protein
MAKTRRKKIAEVVSTPETTPVKDNNAFDQDAYNKRVLDKKQRELEENTVTIDAASNIPYSPSNQKPKDVVTVTGNAKYVPVSGSFEEYMQTPEGKAAEKEFLNNSYIGINDKATPEDIQRRSEFLKARESGTAPYSFQERKKVASSTMGINTGNSNNTSGLLNEGNIIPNAESNLLYDLGSNNIANQTSNTVLKAGINDAKTAGQVFEAPKIAEEVKTEAEREQANLDMNAAKVANEVIQNQPIAPAAYNAVSGGAPTRPTYDQIKTTTDVKNDIAKEYTDAASLIPQTVVEKLSVQDYYPEVGRDIAVGTFTGSRIGSQTIYSGAGGLLPQGLYDARKRALSQAAKEKQAALDKYYAGIDIAAQFQPKFTQTVTDAMDNLLFGKHKGNVTQFLADPESRREFARLEATAKNVNYYDTWAGNILTEMGKEDKFIDPEQVKIAQEIKRALVEDTDGILNGKKDMSALFAKADVYQNIVPQLDKVLKEVLDASRMGEAPINMRTGDADGRLTPEEFVAQRDQFMQKLNDGTLDQAHYVSGFKKFFTGDYEKIIDGLVGSGKYSALQKDAAMNYVAGQLQEQVKMNNEFVKTGALESMRIAEDARQFNAEYERKIKEGETPWTVRNNMMNSVNPSTGKTIQQEFIDLKKQGLTGNTLKNKMLQVARSYGFTAATWDNHTNSVILKENATPNEMSKTWRVNPSNTQSPVMVKAFKKSKKGGKDVWVPVTITANQLANSKYGMYHYKDGNNVKPFLKNDIALYKKAINSNQFGLKTQYYESSWGSVGSQTGQYNPISPNNIGDYSLDRAVNIKQSVGSSYYLEPIDGQPGKFKPIPLPGTLFTKTNISDENSRRSEDFRWGEDKNQFGYTLQGGTSSESEGSYSNE